MSKIYRIRWKEKGKNNWHHGGWHDDKKLVGVWVTHGNEKCPYLEHVIEEKDLKEEAIKIQNHLYSCFGTEDKMYGFTKEMKPSVQKIIEDTLLIMYVDKYKKAMEK